GQKRADPANREDLAHQAPVGKLQAIEERRSKLPIRFTFSARTHPKKKQWLARAVVILEGKPSGFRTRESFVDRREFRVEPRDRRGHEPAVARPVARRDIRRHHRSELDPLTRLRLLRDGLE